MTVEVLPALIGDSYSVGTENSAEVPYMVRGCSTYTEAEGALRAAAEKRITLPNGYAIELVTVRLRRITHLDWEATAVYGTYQTEGLDEFSIEFDISAEQQKITQSLDTINSYVASGDAVDYQGALGVTKDGVEGIEIPVPKFTWSDRWTLPDSVVNDEWVGNLMNIVGRTNSGAYGPFAAGEVLQMGVCGSRRGKERWELSAKFAASPNVTGITIGSITGIAKGGWQYLEVHYEEAADDSAFRMFKRPIQVDIHRVFYTADFSQLQIPRAA